MSVLTGFVMISRAPFSYNLFVETLIVVVALCVSSFPEGFPVVLITTLSSGAYNMAKKNAIVNRMSIIETLGETNVICSDKTGTITKGEMTVKKVFYENKLIDISGEGYEGKGEFLHNGKKIAIEKDEVLKAFLKAGILCNDAKIERKGTDMEYSIIGTPTEASLAILAAKAGIFVEDLKFTREEEIPFSSERKMMSVLCKEGRDYFVYAKGAPEILLKKCKFIQRDNGIFTLSEKIRELILKANKSINHGCFRNIAIAYKKGKEFSEDNLIFLGFAGIEDPPREEVKMAIATCNNAGISVKMITGDHKETAIAIAKQVGLKGKAIEAEELNKLSDFELAKVVQSISIFARVKPADKLRIVRALKDNGEIVSMTGDGVNDAPAMKEAHIGIAMGKGGTDVSREVADLTLKDDNFATIVSAITEGRTIFHNIRKFVTYELSCNYAELLVVFLGILLGLPLPLLALQILFMNLVTDDLPSIALGFNPPSFDVMKNKSRKKSNILNKNLFIMLAIAGSIMTLFTLAVFYFVLNVLNQDLSIARTTALLTLIFFEIANAFNFRSFRYPFYKLPVFANKYLVYASLVSIAATIVIVYSPLNKVFGTSPINIYYWLLAFASSLIIILVFDVLKIKKVLFDE